MDGKKFEGRPFYPENKPDEPDIMQLSAKTGGMKEREEVRHSWGGKGEKNWKYI